MSMHKKMDLAHQNPAARQLRYMAVGSWLYMEGILTHSGHSIIPCKSARAAYKSKIYESAFKPPPKPRIPIRLNTYSCDPGRDF